MERRADPSTCHRAAQVEIELRARRLRDGIGMIDKLDLSHRFHRLLAFEARSRGAGMHLPRYRELAPGEAASAMEPAGMDPLHRD